MPLKPVVWFWVERGGNAFAGDWGVLNAEPKFGGKPCMLWVWGAAEPPKLREAIPASESIWIRKEDYTEIHKPQSRWFLACFVQRRLRIKTFLRKALLRGYCKFWSHPDHPKRLVCLQNALLFFFCNPMKSYSLTGSTESLIVPQSVAECNTTVNAYNK